MTTLATADPSNVALRDMAAHFASASGFFSILMQVFESDAAQRARLVDALCAGVDCTYGAYLGTRAGGCFHANGAAVSRAPNPDGLPNGGRI